MPTGAGKGAGLVPALLRQVEESLVLASRHVHLEDAGLGVDLVAALAHVAEALAVKAAMDGRVEASGDDLGDVTRGQEVDEMCVRARGRRGSSNRSVTGWVVVAPL